MYPLKSISDDLDQFAQTIKSILGTEVLIVDDEFVRLVSTESTRQYSKIDNHSVFANALRENAPFIIDNPRADEKCMSCSDRVVCVEHALVCSPISISGKAVGVIGLIAMTEAEKKALLSKREELIQFLNHIAKLIAIKLEEKQKSLRIEMLASELHCLFEAIEKPMFTCDENSVVIRYNQGALTYFKDEASLQKGASELFKQSEKFKEYAMQKNMRYQFQGLNDVLTGAYRRYEIAGLDEPHYVFVLEDSKAILGMYRTVVSDTKIIKFNELIGTSPAFMDAIERAKRGAQTELSVLLLGESGTGKELFARAIHDASDRQLAPFIAINCAAIPEQLLEAELFGYEEGAFTGALKGGRAGKFELAHGGTLFLDEIGDMPLQLQAKLLRVLQDGYITRVGAHFGHHVNVRIISATHQALGEKISGSTFRKDLYYRIAAYPIELPALRERTTDIPQLVQFFLQKYSSKKQPEVVKVETEAMACLMKHQWDGNVRELENAVAYAMSFSPDQLLTTHHLPQTIECSKHETVISTGHGHRSDFEQIVKQCGTDKKGLLCIQEELGISRATLYRRLKKLKKQ